MIGALFDYLRDPWTAALWTIALICLYHLRPRKGPHA